MTALKRGGPHACSIGEHEKKNSVLKGEKWGVRKFWL